MPGERPRFSELLVDRRRRLGLSLSQASQVLRLKEQVLLAFEEGDFEQMPKSGYAQGMLSSYARYLGLNPKQVTDQYAADLDAYLRSGGRRIGRGAVVTRETSPGGVGSPVPRYQGARGLLPTSGGLAGDYGAFATTSTVRRSATPGLRDSDGHRENSLFDERDEGLAERRTASLGSRAYDEGRRYTTRNPSRSSRTRATGRRMPESNQQGMYSTPQHAYGRDHITTRRVDRGQYVDDLRYGDIRPYEAASTASGRRGSRDIASTRRPNVQRRTTRRSSQPPQKGGLVGLIEEFFSDPRRAVIVVVIIAAIVVTVFLISSVRSCIANRSSVGESIGVTPVASTDRESSDEDNGASAAADEQALADAAATRGQQTIPAETIVSVSIADGMVSWLDIQADGTTVVADTLTGPWEQSFTVEDTIIIQVGDTSSVTVTENGALRKFDTQSSGIGTITIRNAVKAAAEASGSSAARDADPDSASRETSVEDDDVYDDSYDGADDYDSYDDESYDY